MNVKHQLLVKIENYWKQVTNEYGTPRAYSGKRTKNQLPMAHHIDTHVVKFNLLFTSD